MVGCRGWAGCRTEGVVVVLALLKQQAGRCSCQGAHGWSHRLSPWICHCQYPLHQAYRCPRLPVLLVLAVLSLLVLLSLSLPLTQLLRCHFGAAGGPIGSHHEGLAAAAAAAAAAEAAQQPHAARACCPASLL
eukprot:1157731-Pelagomonas_calceolata.AAC.17